MCMPLHQLVGRRLSESNHNNVHLHTIYKSISFHQKIKLQWAKPKATQHSNNSNKQNFRKNKFRYTSFSPHSLDYSP